MSSALPPTSPARRAGKVPRVWQRMLSSGVLLRLCRPPILATWLMPTS